MHSKRILVINSKRLAGGVFQNVLAGQAQYEVIEIDPKDCNELAHALREYQAEVVVVDEQNLFCKQKNIFSLLSSNGSFCDLPDFRLVVVSVEDNIVAVMQRRAVRINQLADFFAVL
ncbi:MAG TPA: hypothetical protein VFF78_08400 [Anaerolineaceae bacterium]|nr:hypothetical protein [Anaerolineaceae bacterium]